MIRANICKSLLIILYEKLTKALKYFFGIILFSSITFTSLDQTAKVYFKTLCTRVQTQGEKPYQDICNFY